MSSTNSLAIAPRGVPPSLHNRTNVHDSFWDARASGACHEVGEFIQRIGDPSLTQSLARRLETLDEDAKQFALPDVISAVAELALTLFAAGPISHLGRCIRKQPVRTQRPGQQEP